MIIKTTLTKEELEQLLYTAIVNSEFTKRMTIEQIDKISRSRETINTFLEQQDKTQFAIRLLARENEIDLADANII